jgi:hypothetical protein
MDATKRKAISDDAPSDTEGSNASANKQHPLKRPHTEPSSSSHDESDPSSLPNVYSIIPPTVMRLCREMYLGTHEPQADGPRILCYLVVELQQNERWRDVLDQRFREMAYCKEVLKSNRELVSLVDECAKSDNFQKLFDSPCKSLAIASVSILTCSPSASCSPFLIGTHFFQQDKG